MKTYQFEDFHEVEAAVVFCVDPRFWRQTIQFVDEELGIKKFDPYTYPGGPLCLARPESMQLYLDNIKAASLELHHAKKIILISHDKCGGYRLIEGVEGEEATSRQKTHLDSIKAKFMEQFPDIAVEAYLLKIVSDNEIAFEKM
ncbi:MAG: carbonic anhydrase [Patescibacteria group bacterium]